MMKLSDEEAQKVVDAVLSTLWERRPFKHDLATMKRDSRLWTEMMEEMRNDLRQALDEVSK